MKRLLLLMATALALFSCVRLELEPDPAAEMDPADGRVVHFRAVQVDTKAQFGALEDGAYPTLWTANDSQVKLSLNYGGAVAADVVPSADFRSAAFDATIDFTDVEGPFTFYSVSPASAAAALSPSREAWKVTIPCEQTPTAGSVDETGIILAATSIAYGEETEVNVVDLLFEHLTAYGRMSFLNLPQGTSVLSVEMTVDACPFVGDWYWKTDGTTLTDYGASSTLTINTSRSSDIWFSCAPVDMSGKLVTFTVNTTAGKYERLMEFPDNSVFEAGQAAVFAVDMDLTNPDLITQFTPSVDEPFTLVTDVSSLQAGNEVLLVYTAGSKALGAISDNGNFRQPVDITISNGSIESVGDATILTLVAGTASGTWAFKDGDNYLASPTASENYLVNSGSVNANSSWSINIDGNGLATVQAQAGGRTYMLYNISSPRFACYDASSKSGMSSVSIYRRSGGAASTVDPMLARSEYGCYLGAGFEWILNPTSDQVTRAYDGDGVLTYTLINASDVEELEVRGYTKSKTKGSHITVTVQWRKGYASVLSTSYSMTLIKEEGPKVWLSDGMGNGFIIKK